MMKHVEFYIGWLLHMTMFWRMSRTTNSKIRTTLAVQITTTLTYGSKVRQKVFYPLNIKLTLPATAPVVWLISYMPNPEESKGYITASAKP